jgi:hypothetical protein
MNNYKKRKLEKLFIDKQFDKLKNIQLNANDVVLNSAAIQDQMLIDLGIKKPKKKIITKAKLNTTAFQHIDLLKINKDDRADIINRQKVFLNNLTFAERVGVKEIKQLPLSVKEWYKLEAKTLEREDHKSNCPICLDALSKRPTSLLSCSHIFHKVKNANFRFV